MTLIQKSYSDVPLKAGKKNMWAGKASLTVPKRLLYYVGTIKICEYKEYARNLGFGEG